MAHKIGLPSRHKTLESWTCNTTVSICILELVSHNKTLILDDGHVSLCISHLKKNIWKDETIIERPNMM